MAAACPLGTLWFKWFKELSVMSMVLIDFNRFKNLWDKNDSQEKEGKRDKGVK